MRPLATRRRYASLLIVLLACCGIGFAQDAPGVVYAEAPAEKRAPHTTSRVFVDLAGTIGGRPHLFMQLPAKKLNVLLGAELTTSGERVVLEDRGGFGEDVVERVEKGVRHANLFGGLRFFGRERWGGGRFYLDALLTGAVAHWDSQALTEAIERSTVPQFDRDYLIVGGLVRAGYVHRLNSRLVVAAHLALRPVYDGRRVANPAFTPQQQRQGGLDVSLPGSFLLVGVRL